MLAHGLRCGCVWRAHAARGAESHNPRHLAAQRCAPAFRLSRAHVSSAPTSLLPSLHTLPPTPKAALHPNHHQPNPKPHPLRSGPTTTPATTTPAAHLRDPQQEGYVLHLLLQLLHIRIERRRRAPQRRVDAARHLRARVAQEGVGGEGEGGGGGEVRGGEEGGEGLWEGGGRGVLLLLVLCLLWGGDRDLLLLQLAVVLSAAAGLGAVLVVRLWLRGSDAAGPAFVGESGASTCGAMSVVEPLHLHLISA